METDILFKDKLESTTIKKHLLILYNDHVNTFDYVIQMLVEICNHDKLQAEQCSILVHYKGKCVVKKGNYKSLKKMSELLSEAGLTVEIN